MKRYLDSSRPLRRRHRRPRSEPGLAATRHHRMPLIFERLEERTLLSASPFDPSVKDRIFADRVSVEAFIGTLDAVVFNNAIGHTLPLVGQFFQGIAGDDLMRPIANNVAFEISEINPDDLTDETLKGAFTVAFEDALEPVLQPIIWTSYDPDSDGDVDRIEYHLQLGGPLVTENLAADFDLGLPALGLWLDTKVIVNAEYQLNLGLGIDAQGFYVKTAPADTALTIDLDVATPGLDAFGALGFLRAHATDQAGPNGKNTGFYGQFSISIEDSHADGGSDSLATIRLPDGNGNGGELDDVSLDTTVTGQADVHLAMSVGILDTSACFPSLHAGFDLTWTFSNSPVDAGSSLIGFGDVPLVAFNNI